MINMFFADIVQNWKWPLITFLLKLFFFHNIESWRLYNKIPSRDKKSCDNVFQTWTSPYLNSALLWIIDKQIIAN